VLLVTGILLARQHILSKRTVTHAPAWGCGYASPSAKLQYTASSFADNLEKLLIPSKNSETRMEAIAGNDLFPTARKYESEQTMPQKRLRNRLLKEINDKLSKLAVFQTGKIQHYVLFALLFMALILVLSYLNLL
jgi:hypothetical protein